MVQIQASQFGDSMRTFVWRNHYEYGSINLDITHNIAIRLIEYGVKQVSFTPHFIAGRKDLYHLNLWENNITCYPGIKVKYEDQETYLVWAIAKHFNIQYCGGAGETYMQISCANKQLEHYRLQQHTPKSLFMGIYCYFNEMQRFQYGELDKAFRKNNQGCGSDLSECVNDNIG